MATFLEGHGEVSNHWDIDYGIGTLPVGCPLSLFLCTIHIKRAAWFYWVLLKSNIKILVLFSLIIFALHVYFKFPVTDSEQDMCKLVIQVRHWLDNLIFNFAVMYNNRRDLVVWSSFAPAASTGSHSEEGLTGRIISMADKVIGLEAIWLKWISLAGAAKCLSRK